MSDDGINLTDLPPRGPVTVGQMVVEEMRMGPGSVRWPTVCDVCGALVAVDQQGKHDAFHLKDKP